MSRRIDYKDRRPCKKCGKTKPLSDFATAGRRKDGSIKYEARCRACKNKGGGVSWLPRSKTHKTCRECNKLKPRSAFTPKARNKKGEAINWHPICNECRQKKVRIPRLHQTTTHKTCGRCKKFKQFSQFSTKGKTQSGKPLYAAKCKQCMREIGRTPEARAKANDYYKRNSQRIKAHSKASYQRHRKKRVAQKAVYREANREKIKEWFRQHRIENPEYWNEKNRASYAKHADKRRQYRKDYVRKFPNKVRETNRIQSEKRYASGKAQAYNKQYRKKNKAKLREYERNYRKTDINRNIGMKLRNRINAVLRYNKKSKPTEDLLGCSVSEFAVHLQSQFAEGMTWEKFLAGEIHIDHIVPCALFDLSLPEEQEECFHFSNLQPLWATENFRKPKYVDPTGKRKKAAKARR